MLNFKLGDSVRDTLTGYKGIVVAVTYWLYGCTRAAVQSVDLKDGKTIEPEWFDEQRVEVVAPTKIESPVVAIGGPQKDPSRSRDP